MSDFVKNTEEILNSVCAFMAAPEYWRDAIGNYPKYFVHVNSTDRPLFGLSKFCAFKNITLQDYVVDRIRDTTGGGRTQQHIKRITGKDWLPLSAAPKKLQKQFTDWFEPITDGRLRLDVIHLMTLNADSNFNKSWKRDLTPESLQKQLAEQEKIGKVGEEIAMSYERNRLIALGAKDGKFDVAHVSLLNTAAGFDIRSSFGKEIRYIEVKSSKSLNSPIYVSANEISTLQRHGNSAYLYIVHVTDVNNKKGGVVRVIENPFIDGLETEWIKPVLYSGFPPPR